MNKPFECFLAEKFEAYINYRKNLGYTEKNIRLCLSYLDNYIKAQKSDWGMFTPSFFLEFRKTLKMNPKSANSIMTVIRGFFWYLERNQESESNPLAEISALKEFHFIPYVFSEDQTEALLLAVQRQIRKDEKHFLHDLAEYTAIVLLVHCGMRISEPTKLLLKNYRSQEGTIYIEKTKFKKDRLIYVPESVIKEIENYLSVRGALINDDNSPYLLIARKDRPLVRSQLYPVFNEAVKDIGLNEIRKTYSDTTFGRPTPHSLRHSFAINTLRRISRQGKSTQNALPVLSAYMGHCQYRDTAVYLKVVDSKQRLELFRFAKSKEGL